MVPLRDAVSVSINGVESPLTVMLCVTSPTSNWMFKAFACSAMTLTLSRTLFLKPDRKSTRLNSSHGYISYAVFCLKKKKISYQQSVPSHRVVILTSSHSTCPHMTQHDDFICDIRSIVDSFATYVNPVCAMLYQPTS